MGVFEVVMFPDLGVNESYLVRRYFWEEDRVNAKYKGKIYSGKVIERELIGSEPYVLIKTKERVSNNKKDLLKGFGLMCPIAGRNEIFFENEPLPNGDPLYNKKITWPMTDEEIREANEPLPF